MQPTYDIYPLFVANQVLKKDHLNALFNYLDEQNRLTRTNLVGVGIVCGVDVIPNPANSSITVTHCGGVTSLGYLVAVEEVVLTRYQAYQVPDPAGYSPLYDHATKKNKFDLWEMLPSGGTNALDATFWRDKVVLIFVELKEENLKNCSPNSCDDRGSEVGITYRYLLIRQQDADELKKARLPVSGNQTSADLDTLQNARALLKEIRLKRFDTPRQAPPIFTTDDLFNAYRKILDKPTIDTIKAELIKAFALYKPLLGTLTDTVLQTFGDAFIYSANQLSLTNPLQYQYYYDFLSDLLEAYNEVRLKGIEAMSVCCPDANWFPRHLMLGKAAENTTQVRSNYRDYFTPSPLFGCHQGLASQLRQLFERLLRMIEQFEVPLPKSPDDQRFVRITPSRLGHVYLSEKSIPFYYRVTSGTPPLYELWNDEKTRHKKAKNNLTYHASQYPAPVENFVLTPLEYDWEPYNFFRIEGHVGLHWFHALIKIVADRSRYRLPFDVVAVKTGRRFDNVFDLHTHACYFQDLETQFEILKEELLCLLCREVQYFYQVPLGQQTSDEKIVSQVALLRHCQADFTFPANTWGHRYEQNYVPDDPAATSQRLQALSIDSTQKDCLFLIDLIIQTGHILLTKTHLAQFPFDAYQLRHRELLVLARQLLEQLRKVQLVANEQIRDWHWLLEELIDHLDAILRTCKIDAIESLIDTFRKRVEAIQQQLLFGNYIRKNPGINHKAGVPVGGTFILVYAGEDEELRPTKGRHFIRGRVLGPNRESLPGVNITVKDRSYGSITDQEGSFQVILDQLPATLLIAFAGLPAKEVVIRDPHWNADIVLGEEEDRETSRRVANNLVIADFYLPYLCCSDCLPIQFNLPKPPSAPFVAEVGEPLCDATGKSFTVAVTLSGGTMPYTVDGIALSGTRFTQTIANGQGQTVKVGDATGQEITVTIPVHTCLPVEEPCDLPCKGQAERCWYPLWLPKPSAENKIHLSDLGQLVLVITDQETGKVFTIDFRDLYKEVLGILSAQDFDERMQKFIEKLNAMIESQVGGPGIFEVLYDAQNRLLGFEHYLCHTFKMDMLVAIVMADKTYPIEAHYDEEQWALQDRANQSGVKGRKFGCETLNKCLNTSVNTCQKEIKPESITARVEYINSENTFHYRANPLQRADTVLWIFENGQPLFSQEAEGSYQLVPQESNTWLLVVRRNCFLVKKQAAIRIWE